MAGVTTLLHAARTRRRRAPIDARVRSLHGLIDRLLDAGVTVGEIESELTALLRWSQQRPRRLRPR
jgi:hypothetical protein